MTVLLPWFALVVTILAGWAIIKRLSTSMVLLFAGLAMISFAVICGVHGFLPKGVKPSGFVWFDIFELLRSIATKQTSGIGLGGTAAAFVTPMQFASGMLRAMSPVAGVIIAVAGAAGVSPMAIVRRTWIPMIAGMITVLIANVVFLG